SRRTGMILVCSSDIDEVIQERQTEPMAFFGVELRAEEVLALHSSDELRTIGRQQCHILLPIRNKVVGVDKIEAALVFEPMREGILVRCLHVAPADIRYRAARDTLEMKAPRMRSKPTEAWQIAFFAAARHQLRAKTNTQDRNPSLDRLFIEDTTKVPGSDRAHAAVEGPDPRQDQVRGLPDIVRILRDPRSHSQSGQHVPYGAEVSLPVVHDTDQPFVMLPQGLKIIHCNARITRAGLPATMQFPAGKDFVTTLPAPTTVPWPRTTPGRMTLF